MSTAEPPTEQLHITASGAPAGEPTPQSFGARLADLAHADPHRPAVILVPQVGEDVVISREALVRRSNQVARLFATHGVDEGDTIVIGLWNSIAHVVATVAAWKLGALVLPLRAILPPPERNSILDLCQPHLVLADWDDCAYPCIPPTELAAADALNDGPLDDDPPHPGKAIASGGSTGRSKIIVDRTANPVLYGQRASRLGSRTGQTQLMCAPLYHNSPFLACYGGLADEHIMVVMERFDAAKALDAIERYRINYAYMPPIIMRRLIMHPGQQERDLSSIEAIQSSAAPCPDWLKRAWIERIGAERVYEVYGSAEGIGATMIRGDEWLEHPGSVGRPVTCDLLILDAERNPLPTGEVGEIFMRPHLQGGPTFTYIGANALPDNGEQFLSIGDLGWVDADGYLYIADRRTDMIVSGGANVYPAEVEAALHDHPEIADLAVIGLADDEWGRRVHAVIQPLDSAAPPTEEALRIWARARIADYKVPRSWEFVAELPRNEAGKIRRSALVDARST